MFCIRIGRLHVIRRLIRRLIGRLIRRPPPCEVIAPLLAAKQAEEAEAVAEAARAFLESDAPFERQARVDKGGATSFCTVIRCTP